MTASASDSRNAVRHGAAAGAGLQAHGVTVRFGGLTALDNVRIAVAPGAVTGLVGPNGAGKTTLFAVLSGLLRSTGTVHLNGQDVTAASPEARARRGLARTFQQPELFLGLTAREHLVVAYRSRHSRSRTWTDTFTAGALRRPDPQEEDRVDSLLEMLLLTDVARSAVGSLPLGTCRLVEVGRALATSPSTLLLDEPLSGLDTYEVDKLAGALRRIVAEEGTGMLLVEHDVAMVLSLCQQIYVLDFGELIAQGPPEQIRADPRVRAAYLGDEDLGLPQDTSTPDDGGTGA
jgi:ABC-type branched-subunit amino acid transport system ATPase component